MPEQMVDAAFDVFEQQVGHVEAEAVSHQHAHDHLSCDVRRHRIRGDLPASRAQPVGEIEQR